MTEPKTLSVRDILLTRCGVACVPPGGEKLEGNYVRALELELAEIGYVLKTRLRDRLANCSRPELAEFRSWAIAALLAHIGGDQQHKPLFRRFPYDVPDDTEQLWWKKVLVHFLQADDQPCLFCGRSGTTHVLNPCSHVVCDHCFDGANYSACPVCEHHVDRSSPFFKPDVERGQAKEQVSFKLIDLAESEAGEARLLFASLCGRTQALSPSDREVLIVILREYRSAVLEWLPAKVPVRENVAIIFGTLLHHLDAAAVLPSARRFMTTATDVLRLIAVMSGTDGSLLPETIFQKVERESPTNRFWGQVAKLIGARVPAVMRGTIHVPIQVYRFKVARLRRSLRRVLFDVLEGMPPDRLTEDMLRHRSYWVWVGEFLHPHEYARRFPNLARAFQIVRKKSEDGSPAPIFRGWSSRLEQAFADRDVARVLAVLSERPGEFARRLDFALRIASDDAAALDSVVAAFAKIVPDLATPVLLTLCSHLHTRTEKAKVRVYWPKGRVATGAIAADERGVLPEWVSAATVRVIKSELLRRISEKPAFHDCLIDEQLRTITVPFNERTASAAAVSVPRGSRFPVQLGKTVRLFLHWCQPNGFENTTDLDLSVAFYDSNWQYLGVCSYYQLQLKNAANEIVATSSGDFQDAPAPDGASEFVDLDCERAVSMGARFAVMVINAYAGLPFSKLERGFAGLMLRDDRLGSHFDPRTVKLKFKLDGPNGVFLPLVLDLHENMLHWLDMQSRGYLEMNNVATSKAAITKICPNLMTYFESGVRPSLYDLTLLHATARSQRVTVRGPEIKTFIRRPHESPLEFYDRLVIGTPDEHPRITAPGEAPILAVLYEGDVELPAGSCAYTLFREKTVPTIAASDLLS
jgi:hypothetical protein